MVMELATIKPEVIVVRSRHPKSIPSDVAADIVTQAGLNVIFKTDDVSEGTRHALCTSNKRGLILATGSLSVVAEVIEVVQDVPREIYPNIKRAFRKDY
jgi:folylpolyglutamate synthase/dihydropteroate synthase